MSLQTLVEKLPKAELHLHIEGSFEPELMFAIAQRNNVKIPYDSVEKIREAYNFDNLQSFLDIYYAGASVLLKSEDFADLAYAYMKRSHADNVRHVELFFDPQTHTDRGISFEIMFTGLEAGLEKAVKEFGMSYAFIMSFLRHLSEEEGFKVLEMAMPFVGKQITAVGLDSSEVGHPPEKFSRLFAKCRDLGMKVVAHAGEEGPPEYVWSALDDLKVCRIDHGVRIPEDEKLLARVVESQMALTVCPNSNVCLKVFKSHKDANCVAMLRKGVCVTINSDDPAYFGGYMNSNFVNILELGLTAAEAVQLAKNSFTASWLADDAKAKHIAEIDAVFAEWSKTN